MIFSLAGFFLFFFCGHKLFFERLNEVAVVGIVFDWLLFLVSSQKLDAAVIVQFDNTWIIAGVRCWAYLIDCGQWKEEGGDEVEFNETTKVIDCGGLEI